MSRTGAMYVVMFPPRSSLFELVQCLRQLGQHLEQIAHEAVVGHLEDRRFFVLVDRDDHLGLPHSRQMLNRTRDPDGNVELRCNHLAGLADLVIIGNEARVDRGTRGPHGRSELVSNLLQQLEVLARPHAPTTGDHAPRPAQLRTFGSGQLLAHGWIVSIGAVPPSAAAAPNPVPRTVITLTESALRTVANTLPA